MPLKGWIIFGLLAWFAGFLQTGLSPKVKMLKLPLMIYFIFGCPSGIKSRDVSFEGFRLQFLGLLLILMPFLKSFVNLSDVYLLLGSLAFSTLISFLLTSIQN